MTTSSNMTFLFILQHEIPVLIPADYLTQQQATHTCQAGGHASRKRNGRAPAGWPGTGQCCGGKVPMLGDTCSCRSPVKRPQWSVLQGGALVLEGPGPSPCARTGLQLQAHPGSYGAIGSGCDSCATSDLPCGEAQAGNHCNARRSGQQSLQLGPARQPWLDRLVPKRRSKGHLEAVIAC